MKTMKAIIMMSLCLIGTVVFSVSDAYGWRISDSVVMDKADLEELIYQGHIEVVSFGELDDQDVVDMMHTYEEMYHQIEDSLHDEDQKTQNRTFYNVVDNAPFIACHLLITTTYVCLQTHMWRWYKSTNIVKPTKTAQPKLNEGVK